MERPDADDFPVLDVDMRGAGAEDAAAQVDSLDNGFIGLLLSGVLYRESLWGYCFLTRDSLSFVIYV